MPLDFVTLSHLAVAGVIAFATFTAARYALIRFEASRAANARWASLCAAD